MDVQSFIGTLNCRGIRLLPDPGLIVEPATKLTDADCELIQQHKIEILKALVSSGRNRWSETYRAPMPLRRCGALVCPTCHIHSPSRHKPNCGFLALRALPFALVLDDPLWYFKCVGCETPADLGLVEAWILARETGQGDGGFGIPSEILSLLRVHGAA